MIWTVISIILIITLLITQSYSIIIMLRAEDRITLYEKWIIEFRDRVHLTYNTMKSVDIRGSFEADDEVGDVFKAIYQMVNDLNDIVSDDITEEQEKNITP